MKELQLQPITEVVPEKRVAVKVYIHIKPVY